MQLIRYVGSKKKMASSIIKHIPVVKGKYYEPFCGSLSIYFKLIEAKKVKPDQSVLIDNNPALINFLLMLRDYSENLIQILNDYKNNRYTYDSVRTDFNNKRGNALNWAAQFYYLQATCFNGLFRVNSKGDYNVPYGKRAFNFNPVTLHTYSHCLQGTIIAQMDFVNLLTNYELKTGDFVYLDPPYMGVFNQYTANRFDQISQLKLKSLCDALTKREIRWLQSNANHPSIKKLYGKYNVDIVTSYRSVAADREVRGNQSELIIRG